MRTRLRWNRGLLLTLSLTLAMACVDQESEVPIVGPEFATVTANPGQPNAYSVYTQNLWLGGDTGPLFELDLSDPSAIGDVIAATSVFWAQVQASNVAERAAEIVNEIDDRRPDVVALQEAVGYATGLLNLATGAFTPTAPGPDLLGSVMADIGARDLPYSVAVMQPTTAIALPIGPPDASFVAPGLAVQDRVVMLRRDDIGEPDTDGGLYAARIPLGPVDFVRGWVRMTVELDGTMHHFVGTHLETQGSDDPASGVPYFIRQVHNAQAVELESVLDELEGVVVLMGDLNSDALGQEGDPSWTPTYGNLIEAGFTDAWQEGPHPSSATGETCCQEDMPAPRAPDERIDFVLIRSDAGEGDNGNHRGWYRTEILGNEESDRTDSGLWPSDHAGIAAWLKVPQSMR